MPARRIWWNLQKKREHCRPSIQREHEIFIQCVKLRAYIYFLANFSQIFHSIIGSFAANLQSNNMNLHNRMRAEQLNQLLSGLFIHENLICCALGRSSTIFHSLKMCAHNIRSILFNKIKLANPKIPKKWWWMLKALPLWKSNWDAANGLYELSSSNPCRARRVAFLHDKITIEKINIWASWSRERKAEKRQLRRGCDRKSRPKQLWQMVAGW